MEWVDSLLNNFEHRSMIPFLDYNDHLLSCFDSEQLTPSQKSCLEALAVFLRSDLDVFFLKGGAGTGKTFLLKGIVRFLDLLQDPNPLIQRDPQGTHRSLVAPTGRAAHILGSKTGVPSSTMHSFVYDFTQAIEFQEQALDGSESIRYRFNVRQFDLKPFHVAIVDEASMVGDLRAADERLVFGSGRLLSDFVGMISLGRNRSKHKAIFVGDPYQLPPVFEKVSPAFDAEYLFRQFGILSTSFELTDVVRQRSTSNVLHQAQHLRASIEKNSFHFKIQTGGDLEDATEIIDLPSHWSAQKGSWPPEDRILLVHSNKEASTWNDIIRKACFEKTDLPQPGDLILVAKNILTDAGKLFNGQIFRCLATPGQVIERNVVIRRRRGDVVENTTICLRWLFVNIQLLHESEPSHVIEWPLLLNSLTFAHSGMDDDIADAMYIDFKTRYPGLNPKSEAFRKALGIDRFFNAIQARYGYAITVHKAQGGEWPHVYLDMGHKTMNSREDFQWAYTAFTRTSDRLYLLSYPKTTPVNWAVHEEGQESAILVLTPSDFPGETPHPAKSVNALLAAAIKIFKAGALMPTSHKTMQHQIRFSFGLEQLNLYYNGDFQFTHVQGFEPATQLIQPWLQKPIRVDTTVDTNENWALQVDHATIPLRADQILDAMKERLSGTQIELEELKREPYAVIIAARRGGSQATFRIHHKANGVCSSQMNLQSNDARLTSLFSQAYNLQLR